jgi:hypothetical protein
MKIADARVRQRAINAYMNGERTLALVAKLYGVNVRRQPKRNTRAGLAKLQIGGLPKSIGVWDSGRGQTKGGSVHGEGYREGNQAGDAA